MDQTHNLMRIIQIKDIIINAQADTIRYLLGNKKGGIVDMIKEELASINEIMELERLYNKEG